MSVKHSKLEFSFFGVLQCSRKAREEKMLLQWFYLSECTWWNKVILMANRADCHPLFPFCGRLIPLTDCLPEWLLAAVFLAWGPVRLFVCVCVCDRKCYRKREVGEIEKKKGIKETTREKKSAFVYICVYARVCVCVCVVAMLSLGPNLFSKPHDPVRNSKWLMSGRTGREGSMWVCVFINVCVYAFDWIHILIETFSVYL